MTGGSTASVTSKVNACKPTEAEAVQQQSTNLLKRRRKDNGLRQTERGMLGEVHNKRRFGRGIVSRLAWWDVHDGVAHDAYSDDANLTFDLQPDDNRRRGRTPEREERWGSSDSTPTGSRASSASSARSMIDERLEWAHQDRLRSASRGNSIPPSPFHENSPFYAEFGRSLNLAPQPRLAYKCECCPKYPKKFDTLSGLRYVSAVMHNVPITLADNPQIARIFSQTYVRLLSKKAASFLQRGRSQV
jgi:hypothetical protein